MSNEELVAVIQAGATECMGQLWEQVNGLAVWKARHIMTALNLRGCPCGVELEDLIQSGYLALVQAVETYDPAAGTFASWFMYYLKTAFEDATGYRTAKGRNDPLNSSVSLDKPVDDEADGATLGEFVPDPKATATLVCVEEKVWQEQLHEALEEALSTLSEESADVLRLRHYQNMTLAEAGESCGKSKEQVRQIENKAIRQLRKPNMAGYLRSFYEFDFYSGSGFGTFQNTGMSIQERYLVTEEERRKRPGWKGKSTRTIYEQNTNK